MSDKKIDEVETMFLKTSKPRLEINEIDPIVTISALYDSTTQGKDALKIALEMAKKFQIPLKIVASGDFMEAFKELVTSTNKKIAAMQEFVDSVAKGNDVDAEINVVMGDRIQNILHIFGEETPDIEKLSNKLVHVLKENQSDILVTGAPLFREEKEESYFGYYLTKIFRDAEIHSNILVVTERKEDLNDVIVSFVSVDQQPKSIVALVRRSLSLANENTQIKLIGMVEDKITETVARADLADDQTDEDIDLLGVRNRIKNKMEHVFSSIDIGKDIKYKSYEYHVRTGVMSSIVKSTLEDIHPGLVLVRSVSRLDENLDPIAGQIALTVLGSGYPVLLVWD